MQQRPRHRQCIRQDAVFLIRTSHLHLHRAGRGCFAPSDGDHRQRGGATEVANTVHALPRNMAKRKQETRLCLTLLDETFPVMIQTIRTIQAAEAQNRRQAG